MSRKCIKSPVSNSMTRRRQNVHAGVQPEVDASFDDTLAILGPKSRRIFNAKRTNTASFKRWATYRLNGFGYLSSALNKL